MFHDSLFALPPTAPAEPADPLEHLLSGQDLTADEAETLFARLVAGQLDDAAMAALFVALRLKGETAAELIGAARALRAAAVPFDRPDYAFADSCGTGADGSGSINVSTAVAFVAAAAGLPMAKHGNRSITSRCGSADVLEALGARIEIEPVRSRAMLDELGFCFLYAPAYHPGLRHAGPVRRRLRVRTIMNFLGPCLNPARPPIQLLGIADPTKLEPVAMTLMALGIERALVVHGAGLDEVALHGETLAVRLQGGQIDNLAIRPEDAGLGRAPIEAVKGGDPQANALRLRALLGGQGETAERDLVLINSGALLMTAGLSANLSLGVALARDTLASGRAGHLLADYIEASRG
jgi:anthranilate phosphoribosyltransferase